MRKIHHEPPLFIPSIENNALPDNWLCIRLGHLGDVALTTGVLNWLGETRGWTFDFLTIPAFAEILTGHPYVRQVITIDKKRGAGEILREFRSIAGERQGWGLLDLHGNLRSRMLSSVWKGPVKRYDKMSLARRFFMLSNKRFFGEKLREYNVTQRYALAVTDNPPAASALLPQIRLGDLEHDWARNRLKEMFPGDPRPVALHPYATHKLKAWPAEYFKEIAATLDDKGIPWICLGKGDAPLFPDRKEDLTNKTDLRELCALLAESRVLLTGDSGPMHLASAVGTSVLALFGPTSREWGFYPAGPKDMVMELDLPCRPCSLHGKKPCPKGMECLLNIQPVAVMKKLEERFL